MIGDAPGQRRRLHTQDRRATGNPVYNGASNAATFGTVDPAGYADRERRSQLARSILTRGQAGPTGSPGADGDPSLLVGESAAQMDHGEIVRRLAARMGRR